jgi:hypothetical protein
MTAVLPSPHDPASGSADQLALPSVAPAAEGRYLPVLYQAPLRDAASVELPFSTVRRWRQVLLGVSIAVTLTALAVAAAGWFTSHRSAERWRRQANTSDVAVRNAIATVGALQGQLDDTRAQLSASQGDARALQARLDQLAAEKAKVEDEREGMKTVNARLQEISQALSTAVAGANNCSSQALILLQRSSRGLLSSSQVQGEAARIDGVCQKADVDRQTVADLLDRLYK